MKVGQEIKPRCGQLNVSTNTGYLCRVHSPQSDTSYIGNIESGRRSYLRYERRDLAEENAITRTESEQHSPVMTAASQET